MLDLRHTLPNLKNLLVTLSSPDPPSPGPVSGPGWASGAASRASSRKPSAAWSYRSASTLCLDPSMSFMSAATAKRNTLSPISLGAHSASLASASIHSVCPTNEDMSVPSASAAVSPLPWRRPLGEKEEREPVGFVVGSPERHELPEQRERTDAGAGDETIRASQAIPHLGGESGNESDDESDGSGGTQTHKH